MREYIVEVVKEELSDYVCENMSIKEYLVCTSRGINLNDCVVEGSEYIELDHSLFVNEDMPFKNIFKAITRDNIEFKLEMKLSNDDIGSECTVALSIGKNRKIVVDIY